MKNSLFMIMTALLLYAAGAYSADSFRLENGQLLENGMTKAEVLDQAGKPVSKDSHGQTRKKAGKNEVWTYFINDTFGTPSIVTLTFRGDEVVKVTSKQREPR